MHTLLILDDIREGYPCAFLISNCADEDVIKLFFNKVKQTLGETIRSKVFMSDMAEVYYNAWMQVMEPSEMRLFCAWHVDRAWRNNLTKINTNEKKADVYKMLRTLLHETDLSAFNQMLTNFLTSCKNDPDTKEFGNYFEMYYKPKAKEWAYCYRINSGVNTNMHLERMHRTLKYIYLEGRFVKRLDKAIYALMKFVRDKLFERLIIIHKGKVCRKLTELRQRHKISDSMQLDLVVETELAWEIGSSRTGEIYVVQEVKKECNCRLVCTECDVCLHQYSCTCIDSCIKWNMCKHIHLVCKYRKYHQPSDSREFLLQDKDHLMGAQAPDDTNNDETLNLVEAVSQTKNNRDWSALTLEKKKILDEFAQKLNRVETFEELEIVKKCIAPIDPTLDAVKKQIPQAMLMQPAKTPYNKSICQQRRLFRTKKIKKNKNKNKANPDCSNLTAMALMNPVVEDKGDVN